MSLKKYTLTKDQVTRLFSLIHSLAVDCSQHLREQHGQDNPNDKPRFYFDNIAQHVFNLRDEILGKTQ